MSSKSHIIYTNDGEIYTETNHIDEKDGCFRICFIIEPHILKEVDYDEDGLFFSIAGGSEFAKIISKIKE